MKHIRVFRNKNRRNAEHDTFLSDQPNPRIVVGHMKAAMF